MLSPRTALVLFAAILFANVWGTFGFLTVVRDTRLRVLLDAADAGDGVLISRTEGLRGVVEAGAELPGAGDRLVMLGDLRVGSVFDLFEIQDVLLRPPERLVSRVDAGTDWFETPGRLGPIVFDDIDWWVRAVYQPADGGEAREAYLLVQGVPWGELSVTLVWAVFQIGVFLLAAVSWWYRPFDPASRSFFFMTGTMLGAYVGAMHWWAAANSVFVLAPFAIYGFFLPAVSVHLSLTFPRLVPVPVAARRMTTRLLYAGPVLATVGFLAFLAYAVSSGGDPTHAARDHAVLAALSYAIRVFAVVAFAHYLAMVAIIAVGWRRTTGELRRSAGRLLIAATLTAIPIGYTVTLAWVDRVGFAYGGVRWPMLLAGTIFSAGYAIGLGPAKLTTLDAVAGRGVRYLFATGGLAVAFVLAVGFLLGAQSRLDRLSVVTGFVPAGAVATVFVVAVLLWLRDRAQDVIDRRFFRDKYQLDATLRGVNRAAVDESDPRTLTTQMLASCRGGLGAGYAALYRRPEPSAGEFERVAFDGDDDTACPPTIAAEPGLVRALSEGGVRRSVAASASRHPTAQRVLRAVDAAALYPLPGRGRLDGFVAIGRKAKDAPLSAEDLTLVDAVTHVLAAATGLHERFEIELKRRAETIGSLERQVDALRHELAGTYAATRGDEEPEEAFSRDAVIGQSAAVKSVLASARKVATSGTTVLVRGESGTGKELLAQAIHENGPRRDGPLVKVNCAALASGVLESELFGHVKGAFTGADRDKPGRFRAADGGTLFLDEVGDIPAETQVKLLRVLQERSVEPVGSHESVEIDVRLVAATNRDLEAMIADGTFREDLFYRLNVVTLTLPPLRERTDDLEELAVAFLHRSARESGRSVIGFGDGVLDIFRRYPWPGNIRELRNVIERAVVLADEELIRVADLPAEMASLAGKAALKRRGTPNTPRLEATSEPSISGPDSASGGERDRLARVLAECGGNKAAAARRLGVARSTLFSKLKKHGIG